MCNTLYRLVFVTGISFFLASCPSEHFQETQDTYTVRIAWSADTQIVRFPKGLVLDGDYLFAYEDAVYGDVVPNYANADFLLTKIDVRTGGIVWRTGPFPTIELCAPQVIDGYVYAFIKPSLVYCFDKNTGSLSAVVELDAAGENFMVNDNPVPYGNYFYFGWGTYEPYKNYFARFDVSKINKSAVPSEPQLIAPEILWSSEHNTFISSMPVMKDNIVYFNTHNPHQNRPIEVVGIDMTTKGVVFRDLAGMSDTGSERYGLSIHGDILYRLDETLSAYNLKTGKRLFFIEMQDKAPKDHYAALNSLEAMWYEGKMYYTNINANFSNRVTSATYRNIHCIDADTGKLVWSDIPAPSFSLGTNPIVINNKVL